MSRHHWMYFGCQCSSARCRRLLLERFTLFGIFSAEIISSTLQHGGSSRASRSLPIELGPPLLSVDFQRAFFADGVRPLENPVLPRSETAEDFRFHRLGAGEAEVGLESGHRVRRERRARFD